MKFFFPQPALASDEAIQKSWLANHTQRHWRGVGGKLFVTESRLLFQPNRMDARLGGQPLAIPLNQITTVGEEPRRLSFRELFSGGLRTRLRIEVIDGRIELFVVQRLSDVVYSLTTQLSEHAA